MVIEDKLEELGFIVKRRLRHGINRVATQHKPDKRNGTIYVNENSVVYMSFDDSIDSGFFLINEDASSGMSDTESKMLWDLNRIESDRVIKEEKEKRLTQIRDLFSKMHTIKDHAYLRKKLSHFDTKLRIDFYGNVVVPMFNTKAEIMGYQMIKESGEKRFKSGSQLDGSFFPILSNGKKLKDQKIVLLAEGYATASSIYQAVGTTTIVCFSAGNIEKVKSYLKGIIYGATICIVHDNDIAGLKCSKGLGITVGAEGQDANDVHVLYGIKELRNQLISELKYVVGFRKDF